MRAPSWTCWFPHRMGARYSDDPALFFLIMPMDKTTPNAAQSIAQTLSESGVRFVFGMPGGEVVDLIEALETQGIQFILMGHESAAALAAGTLGAVTGTPGVCLATLGPGACNLVLGVAEALLERHPLLAISARTAVALEGWNSHQQLPLNEMFAPIAKDSIALHLRTGPAAVMEALRLAATPPRGPVYLSLPADLAVQPASEQKSAAPPHPIRAPAPAPLEPLLDALRKAVRPLAVVGIALDPGLDGPAVRRFLAETGIPYTDTPKSKGLVDQGSDSYLGTCLSASGDALLAEFIRSSDCLLGIGFDPVESAYDWHRGPAYYGITNAPTSFREYRPHWERVGRVAETLDELAACGTSPAPWDPEELQALRSAIRSAIQPDRTESPRGLAPYQVAVRMQAVLPAEIRLSLDTGQHKMLFCQAWRPASPEAFFCSNGLSSMGPGLPGAIALAIDDPDRPAVCVTGDGGFAMMVQELETVHRLGIAPLIVVLCDQALSLIRLPQMQRGYSSHGIEMVFVDWAAVARGFGLEGTWARTTAELNAALATWADNPVATVLAVQVDESLYRGNHY